jgi:hypothetical protein
VGVPAQTPLMHVRAMSHMLLPVQAIPSGLLGLEHIPDVGSHIPAV